MSDVKEPVQLRTSVPLDLKSVKPFRTKDEYLYAMKEDLAEWFNDLYSIPITVEDFFEHLDSGVLLCRHANTVLNHMSLGSDLNSNENALVYRSNAQTGTFQARDNISIFIRWCRKVLDIRDTLLFETEDLVGRKNERNVVLGILEVARKGAKFGVLAPQLIQFEQEIDEEIELEKNPNTTRSEKTSKHSRSVVDNNAGARRKAEKNYIEVDMMSLDEMVRLILSRCKCEHQYPMVRLAEGKYSHGNDQSPVFLRVLRRHVMVRTGGGWDTLESYLDRHDPCRCNSKEHRGSMAFRNQQKGDTQKARVENGDLKPKSSGSTDSVPSSESSGIETKSKSGTLRKHDESSKENFIDSIPDEINTLSLLKDVVNLIEKPNATVFKVPNVQPNKIKERPKSSKCTPINKSNETTLGPNNKKPISNVIRSKTLVANSKSLCSSRENLLPNKLIDRRKSDIFALSELKKTSNLPETPTINKYKVRPKTSNPNTPSRASFSTPTRPIDKKKMPVNNFKIENSTTSKSLNSSCENLLVNRRRSEYVPSRHMTPSKSFQTYNNMVDDAPSKSAFKKPANPPPKARQATPKRPASARTNTVPNSEKLGLKVKKATELSKCSQSLENLSEDISMLQHFQSQETFRALEKGSKASMSKPRHDITCGLKTRIPAPINFVKCPDAILRRTDSGVDITGAQDFIDLTPKKNTFFDDADYY